MHVCWSWCVIVTEGKKNDALFPYSSLDIQQC